MVLVYRLKPKNDKWILICQDTKHLCGYMEITIWKLCQHTLYVDIGKLTSTTINNNNNNNNNRTVHKNCCHKGDSVDLVGMVVKYTNINKGRQWQLKFSLLPDKTVEMRIRSTCISSNPNAH